MNYSAKVPTIINYTITASATWQKAASAVPGVRKWMIKARESTDNSYDWAFTAAPTLYMTNSGQGTSFDGCDLPDIYVRSDTINTIIEICYWG